MFFFFFKFDIYLTVLFDNVQCGDDDNNNVNIFDIILWCIAVFHQFSYDVVFTSGADTILEKFAKFDARVVFGAEDAIWPDSSLEVRE